jgi:ribosomal protein L16 Arg81 hydroxylase
VTLSQLTLSSLVDPLTEADFVERHFLPEQPFLSSGSVDRFAPLLKFPELNDLELLLGKLQWVMLFGVGGFRAKVPASVGMDFYQRGDTLYLMNIETAVPEAMNVVSDIAMKLGIAPTAVSLEAFATRLPGAAASLHYDHDVNFQLLLKGRKRWTVQRNHHIRNPLGPLHRIDSPDEEAHASRLPFPRDLSEGESVEATAGSVLFLPMAYWHQTVTEEESFAVNIALKPQRWAEAIGGAIVRRLLTLPDMRACSFGAVASDDTLPLLEARALEQFALARALAGEVLGTLSIEESAFARDDSVYAWTERTAGRTLQRDADGDYLACLRPGHERLDLDSALVPLVGKILPFVGRFTLHQLAYLEPQLTWSEICGLAEMMLENGYWIRGRARRPPG